MSKDTVQYVVTIVALLALAVLSFHHAVTYKPDIDTIIKEEFDKVFSTAPAKPWALAAVCYGWDEYMRYEDGEWWVTEGQRYEYNGTVFVMQEGHCQSA